MVRITLGVGLSVAIGLTSGTIAWDRLLALIPYQNPLKMAELSLSAALVVSVLDALQKESLNMRDLDSHKISTKIWRRIVYSLFQALLAGVSLFFVFMVVQLYDPETAGSIISVTVWLLIIYILIVFLETRLTAILQLLFFS